MSKGGFFDFHEQIRRKPRPPAPHPTPAPAPAVAEQAAGPPSITVSELTGRIDRALKEKLPETLYVRGEISNYRPHPGSGHAYFTLKDAVNCIDCVMWRSDAVRLKFTPTAGMELLATAKLGVYGRNGKYQLYVTTLRPLGQGALELAFQQLRAKLETEGLFAQERKKKLPMFPMTIALVTGADTAALADMLKVLRRFPWLRLMVQPVPVQGQGAGERIAEAIMRLSHFGAGLGIEAVVLGRGGGSLEDLWAFNEEIVARAIAGSSLPVVTGIGHEVDTTIADLVADYHAHTPTEAAQTIAHHWRTARDAIISRNADLQREISRVLMQTRQRLRAIERHEAFRRPLDRIHSVRQFLDDRQRALTLAVATRLHVNRNQLSELQGRLHRRLPGAMHRRLQQLEGMQRRLNGFVLLRLRTEENRLTKFLSRLERFDPRHRIALHRQHIVALSARLTRGEQSCVQLKRERLEALARHLHAVGPANILRRGYTITLRKKDGVILRESKAIKLGEAIVTRFSDGETVSITQDTKQAMLFE